MKIMTLLAGIALVLGLAHCTGIGPGPAAGNDPVPVASLATSANESGDYIVALEYDTPYIVDLPDGSQRRLAMSVSKLGFQETATFTWGDVVQKCDVLRATERRAYLVRSGGEFFVYLYEDVHSHGVSYFRLTDSYVTNVDNRQVVFVGEPTDPDDVVCRSSVHILGSAQTEFHAYVGEYGKLYDYERGDYRYCAGPGADETLVLDCDIVVDVFASADEADIAKPTRETLPAGTEFTRLRTDFYENIADVLLPDGRVARIYQRYYWSEPQGFYEYLDAQDGVVEFH